MAPVSFDFGTVLAGETIQRAFEIRNEGRSPLTLGLSTISLPGLAAKFPPQVKPGEAAKLAIEWKTAGLKGPVEAQLLLKTNDPAQPEMQLIVRGQVRPRIEVQPLPAVLFSVFRGEQAERTVRIVNNAPEVLSLSPREYSGEHFRATVKPVEPGRAYELAVIVPEQETTGRFVEYLQIPTNDPVMPQLRVPVGVLVKPDLYANPEAIEFGTVSAENLKRNPALIDVLVQTFMVKKKGGEFRITSVESTLACVRLKQDPAAPGRAFRIDASLAPERMSYRGDYSGEIRITTDDPLHARLVVPVKLSVR